MSRNNDLVSTNSTSSTSQLESPPRGVQQNFYTINISFNYSTQPNAPAAPEQNPEQLLPVISNLIAQQIRDLKKQEQRRKRRSRRSSSRTSRPSKEDLFSSENDCEPMESTQRDVSMVDDVTQKSSVPLENSTKRMSKKKASKYSNEYQDLSEIQKKVKYRLVPSKNVKAVPEDELPKKKYNNDRKRREYVVLGRLNSLEVVSERDEEQKKEDAKRRSRELAKELY
ncbi:hypothetical protein CRE_10043 [Caenorhabditis remanei]|uniref:Uncharacterized protein n=1 Tax=Caenorhabditis remanei TaxID=31234 RepID=E3M6Y6_CAERE|nr:hypothetical protein CRE_10043 [Caenorhabditis remanei]